MRRNGRSLCNDTFDTLDMEIENELRLDGQGSQWFLLRAQAWDLGIGTTLGGGVAGYRIAELFATSLELNFTASGRIRLPH